MNTATENQPRAAVRTTYLDPATGDVYLLRTYLTDYEALLDDPDLEKAKVNPPTRPDYGVLRNSGSFSVASTLPEGAQMIWTPTEQATPNALSTPISANQVQAGVTAGLATLRDRDTGAGSDLTEDIEEEDDVYVSIFGNVDFPQLAREIIEAAARA